MKRFILLIGCVLLLALPVSAQDNVPVPDLTGLPLPQAASILNLLGLNLGAETAVGWAADSGQPQNTIQGQSVEPGAMVTAGTAIDITVVRSPNMRLIYDDNDLTAINLTDSDMTVGGLVFASVDGTPANYAASQITGRLGGAECLQLWSISRNNAKDVEGCRSTLWRTTNNTGLHFWTQVNRVNRFSVSENGIERAVCNAAPPNSQDSPTTCEFFLAGGSSADDVAPFIYLAYTANAIAFINSTPDKWMVTDQTTLVNNNPNLGTTGATLVFGDPSLLREEFRSGVGDVTQLAPHQCIMFTATDATVSEPPETCQVIAQRALDGNTAFWRADFEIQSVTDGKQRMCPGASSSRMTLCIVPR